MSHAETLYEYTLRG